MQAYSDPKRASDPHALPDVEVFDALLCECYCESCDDTFEAADPWVGAPWAICPDCAHEVRARDFITPLGKRWYWHSCFPGCMPDSDPFGPFATEAEALADAQYNAEE